MSMDTPLAHVGALRRTGAIAIALSLVFGGLGHDARASETSDLANAVRATDGETKVLDGQDVTSSMPDGITAQNGAFALVHDTRVAVTGPAACGLHAQRASHVQAADAKVTCTGRRGPAVVADAEGDVSLASSSLRVTGAGSSLVRADGAVDLSHVEGRSQQGALANIGPAGSLLVVDSSLTSGLEGAEDAGACGILMEGHGTDRTHLTCLRSQVSSAISSGSMLRATDASADVMLASTRMSYDSFECDLLRAHDQSDVRLTMRGSQLEGNVSTDGHSSALLSLENDSTWTGLPSGDGSVDVSVDASSNWVVADSCSVARLSVEPGALVVDERGDTVSVSVAGQLVTRGTSDVCVSVTDAYETGPSPATRATLPDPIDRSAYDEAFGTSTSLSTSMETQPQTPMAPPQLHSAPTAPSLLDLFIDWVKETVGI